MQLSRPKDAKFNADAIAGFCGMESQSIAIAQRQGYLLLH